MSNKTHWERFQELHALIIRAGAICDQIILHPDSHEALTLELAPRERGKVFNPPLLTGAVTNAGPVKIVSDPSGVKL